MLRVHWCKKVELLSDLFSFKNTFSQPWSDCEIAPPGPTRLSEVGSVILQSPNYPDEYTDNLSLAWNFMAEPGHVIKVLVLDFEVGWGRRRYLLSLIYGRNQALSFQIV